MKKGAGMKGKGNFEEWFHGIITRKEAEQLLMPTAAGTFLVRVAESRFGYSLSHWCDPFANAFLMPALRRVAASSTT